MTEIEVRQSAEAATIGPEANFPTGNHGAMRLVEWAEEARAANHLATALVRTPFAGAWKGDVDGATAAILKGSEVGLTPVTALGAFDNIQGTPAPKAITLRALVQSHGHDLEILEATDERAVARYRRGGRGDWLTTEFTIADAQRMNLTSKDNWKKQPGNMLVARVTSKAARLVASDVILGIGYSAEEIRDEAGWDGTIRAPREVAAAQPASERMAAMLGKSQSDPEPEAPVEDAPLPMLNTSSGLARRMFALLGEAGVTEKADRLLYVTDVVGREVASSKEMTERDAWLVIEALEKDATPPADVTGADS